MFILEITNGVHQGQCVRLVHSASIVLGRAHTADLNFNDHEASGHHARFTWDDTGFSITDLESTNGTLLNGTVITGRQYLKLGDFIQVGKTIVQLKQAPPGAALQEFKLSTDGGSSNVPKVFSAKTMMAANYEELLAQVKNQKALVPTAPKEKYLPSTLIEEDSSSEPLSNKTAWSNRSPEREKAQGQRPQPSILAADKTTIASAVPSATQYSTDVDAASRLKTWMTNHQEPGPFVVVQLYSSDAQMGLSEDIYRQEKISFGRETTSDVLLENEKVSLTHFVIERREDRYFVCDQDSANGTYINGARVVERKLQEGDVITCADHNLLVVRYGNNLGLAVTVSTVVEPESQRAPTIHPSNMPLNDQLLGVVMKPTGGKKKKKKKATDLIWFATSDLDRGVFRARSALFAIACALGTTGYLLATGDSEVLAGGALVSVHESSEFTAQAEALGFGGCTSCHIGAGQVSTLKCVSCHEDSRPQMAHVNSNLQCTACHKDHQGSEFRSAANATVVCVECHSNPHQNIIKINPQLVEGFRLDAVADSSFHLKHHIDREVSCATCHGEEIAAGPRGPRASCGQCHAPQVVSSSQCQNCHKSHPDQPEQPEKIAVAPKPLPQFRYSALVWLFGLIVVPISLAGILPRSRKVNLYSEVTADKKEEDKKS